MCLCITGYVYSLPKLKHSDKTVRTVQLCPRRTEKYFAGRNENKHQKCQTFYTPAKRKKRGLEEIVRYKKNQPHQFHYRFRGAENAIGREKKSIGVHCKTG